MDKTAEYAEMHYFKKTKVSDRHLYSEANLPFFADYLAHLISGDFSAPFMSAKITKLQMNVIPFVFGLLDLPLESPNFKSAHRFKSD
jgi:hypothetical protein